MLYPEKTITDNPFVDNILYYSKYMALNCTVKDQDEALSYETPASLKAREVLISSVEGTATYEIYETIPKEILQKYITLQSNLDIYANSIEALKTHMNSYGLYERTKILNELSELARKVYINHYEIMLDYLDTVGDSWFADNEELYNNCKNLSATYKELFDQLPKKTRYRIINTYINNYDDSDMEVISDTLETFENYINNRQDESIIEELNKINKAMRDVFISHYDIMIQREYVRESDITWRQYMDDIDVYNHCKNGTSSYIELYPLFPKDSLLDSLNTCLGEDIVNKYGLDRSVSVLQEYINDYSSDPKGDAKKLTDNMSAKYLANYSNYLNNHVYNLCIDKLIDYYELAEYFPVETRKMIINSQEKEVTNLDIYADNKAMLNSYLNTLPAEERNNIKSNITKDMMTWYPSHHIETNNYYRALMGLPPMGEDGTVFEDTLTHTWDDTTKQFKEFGKRFISKVSGDLYPEIHWKQNIYEFDSYDIGILNQQDILDDWIALAGGNINDIRYRYLRYLGDNKLDIYTCSRALEFQLIGIPTIDDSEFSKKFVDSFAINRDYTIRTVYSDAYKFQSDYYNKFIIIFMLVNTIMDCLVDIPEYIINREVFDSRCIKYLFEANGIPYYSEIPVKYQQAMLKNLNILIKFKSSTRNMIDICSLFGFSDVRVFGYYLFKQRNVDSTTGEYKFKEDNSINYSLDDLYVKDPNGNIKDYNGIAFSKLSEYRNYDENKYTKEISISNDDGSITKKRVLNNDADVYVYDEEFNEFIPLKDTDYFTKIKADTSAADLKFIKVPVNEDLSDYKNDPNYIINYHEMVAQDEGDTWDGGEDHWHLYNRLLDHEFNAVKTKYISVETVTEMTELSFQVSYFYNMLFDNLYSEDALTVDIPYIKIGHKFRFMDVVCYLFALMYLYNGLEDNIMYSPTQILYVKGYNFNEDLNEVLKDSKCFQQTNALGEPLKDKDKYNIFDINTRIAEDGYDYREAFKDFNMRAFNLECDVDELDAWLRDNFQMSLDDFVVDDTLTKFSQIITLRSFFSLNNSYYQKSIFKPNLNPIGFNESIKYGFNYLLYLISMKKDINDNEHYYITEDKYQCEVISNMNSTQYILDNINYMRIGLSNDYAIYHKYERNNDSFNRVDDIIYVKTNNTNNKFIPLFSGSIGIVNNNGQYIFAADNYYRKNENNEYIEIIEDRYFREDPNDNTKKVLNFGEYYIFKDGKWILDPDNCYIKIEKDGKISYVLVSEAGDYDNKTIPEEKCYILHDDGHFIKLSETDYYKKKQNGEKYNGYVYTEEDCYIISETETEYFDPTVDPIVYYQKLSDYYDKNNYIVYNDYYVKDSSGNYIPQTELLDPNNCYYDKEGVKYLVINSLAKYMIYNNPKNIKYILVLEKDYDYYKYELDDNSNYNKYNDDTRQYVYNSDTDYITVIIKNATYDITKSMIVIFNKFINGNKKIEDITDGYNPELTDGIWDENDWYYNDEYAGEHLWYYRKPGSTIDPEPEDPGSSTPVGVGFYLEASSYLGDTEIEKGIRYYIILDIETNFSCNMQIACTADSSVENSQNNVYSFTQGESKHVSQTFIANDITRPSLNFFIYDYEDNPINIGDFITISNIKVIKAYNNNSISQDIPSYDKLQELYRTNEAIYKYLVGLMNNCDNIHMYKIYKKLYDSLMISKYNKEAFKLGENKYAKTYTDFLETRDAVLYEKLCYFKSLDEDAMHKQVADNIVEVAYAIDDCIDTYSYGYLYSYFPAVSASYIQQYIIKIINFFKSWKVHLLGINTVYKFDDKFENTVKILECRKYRTRIDEIKSNIYIHDTIKINPMDDVNISGNKYTDLFPDLVSISHKYKDKYTIRDRVRIMSTTANKLDHLYDSDGELQLILNNATNEVNANEVNTDDGILKIISSNSGFETVDDNTIEMTSTEKEQDVFGIQSINEINYNSTDIIEWEDMEDKE